MTADIIVIGAGPAGMMAAITAAENGADVILIERNRQPGKKLLITGKGRCNVTNNCTKDEFFDNLTCNAKFLYSAYNSFNAQDTMSFFEGCGVELKTERGNRVFPVSDKSADINNALIDRCSTSGVRIIKGKAEKILTDNGRVISVIADGSEYACKCCIIATGGTSYRSTGSDGNGYKLAKSIGHTITDIKPSLVPVVCREDECKELAGLTLKNVSLSVKNCKGKQIYTDFGELTFMDYGISGPMTLSASCRIDFDDGEKYFDIDLKPALSEEQLEARLLRDFDKNRNITLSVYLGALLPRQLIAPFISRLCVPETTMVNSITKEQRRAMIKLLKNYSFTAYEFRPINEAIITSGGIKVSEIEPKTMASKLVKGIYFAGEIIDVDAYTGGFNLQIAFSTGFAAGKYASEECRND